jgi:hypothetical protein
MNKSLMEENVEQKSRLNERDESLTKLNAEKEQIQMAFQQQIKVHAMSRPVQSSSFL